MDELPLSEGPGWAPHSLDVQGGRYPLAVEAHLLNMTASLVPGATTVTTSARYFTLHGAVALEAERRSLEATQRLELLRRCEVVMAAASIVHPAPEAGTVHGYDRLMRLAPRGTFDVDRLATPKQGYADPVAGFLGPYNGSELTLGILAEGTLAPGRRLDSRVLASGFEGLFDLARQRTVTAEELRSVPGLSIGAVGESDDGAWLARQMCAVDLPEATTADTTRAGTVRLMAHVARIAPSRSIVTSFRQAIAYGPVLRNDAVVRCVPEAEPWRGVLLRHDSVGAWRQLWAWLVDTIDGPTRRTELVDKLADALPGETLGEFERGLPPTIDAARNPLDAESAVRGEPWPIPRVALALVVLGARRADELDGTSRSAFVGNERRVAVLSPLWMAQWVDNRRRVHLRDVAAELTGVLLDRAQRIAMGKMRMRGDRMWLPSVVGERGEFLYTVGREGRGNVGLRLEQLAGLLRGLGVLTATEDGWTLGPRGQQFLGEAA